MPLDHTENFVASETTADIASGDTSISVTDASAYPDPASVGAYNVVIDDSEIVRLTAIDTTNDVLTVTRGQENTSAQSFTAPVVVEMNATRKLFRDSDSALESVADYSGTPPTADNLTSQLGTSSNRQDAYLGATDAQSVSGVQIVGPNHKTPAQALSDLPANGGVILMRGASDWQGVTTSKRLHIIGGGIDPEEPLEVEDYGDVSGGDGVWFKRECHFSGVTFQGSGGTYNVRFGELGGGEM